MDGAVGQKAISVLYITEHQDFSGRVHLPYSYTFQFQPLTHTFVFAIPQRELCQGSQVW